MNKQKTIVSIVLLVVIIGGVSVLSASGYINIAGLIQTGDYFNPENVHHININGFKEESPNLQTVEVEDYYSVKVANIYDQSAVIYTTGAVDFVSNYDRDGQFERAYIVYLSDEGIDKYQEIISVDNEMSEADMELVRSYLPDDLPEIEECESKEQCEARTDEQLADEAKVEAAYAEAYEQAGFSQEDIEIPNLTKDDIIVEQYDDQASFDEAISTMIGQEISFDDLNQFE